MSKASERKAFEAWLLEAKERGWGTDREVAWLAWQARASIASLPPKPAAPHETWGYTAP